MTDTLRPTAPQANGGYTPIRQVIPPMGMFAGPEYAGGQVFGANVTPGTNTWTVKPVNFLDQVTRTHDINYTWIEKLYPGTDAASRLARDQAMWQADKEMLMNVMSWTPPAGDWISSMYREALIKGFSVKALGYQGVNLAEEWVVLGKLDSQYATPPIAGYISGFFSSLGTLNTGRSFEMYGLSSLTGSGLNVQQMLLFNQHITPAQAASYLRNQIEQPDAPSNYDNKVVIPQRDANDPSRYFADIVIDGKTVRMEMFLDRDTLALTSFTRVVSNSGALMSQQTVTVPPSASIDNFGQSDLASATTTYPNGIPSVTNESIAAPAVQPLTVSVHSEQITSKVTNGELSTMDEAVLAAERAKETGWIKGEDPILKYGITVDSEARARQFEAFRKGEIEAQNMEAAGGTTTDSINITPKSGSTSTNTASDPTTAPNANAVTLEDNLDYTVSAINGNVNTDQGNKAVGWGMAADGVQPGAQKIWDAFGNTPGDAGFDPSTAYGAGQIGSNLNHEASSLTNVVPVDPLVLDLNGDGVKLTNYTDAPVLFDADNDGGSLEQTGWVSSADGIVVHDLNGDGKINNIRETLSEYYNGIAGSAGMAGTKPFANGFAALKSLDSNADNQFTSTDAAWSSLRVWVDANYDAKTDTGELKTFADLGITAINLASTAQSGEVRDGNEVLARGTFTQTVSGTATTREAIAANFLANPAGSTITVSGSGVIVATESIAGGAGNTGAITSFVSQNTLSTVNETLNAVTLAVRHLTGGAGADSLTGDAQNNWLAGGLGADKLYGGVGDVKRSHLSQRLKSYANSSKVRRLCSNLWAQDNSWLGYRGIQTILDMNATKVDDSNGTDWSYNTAQNWNGSMHVSHDYGFGKVDARVAVRLAERV